MLENYVGEESFLKGVSIYLKKNMYKNTVTKDLWEGIRAATGLLSRTCVFLVYVSYMNHRHRSGHPEAHGQLGQAGEYEFGNINVYVRTHCLHLRWGIPSSQLPRRKVVSISGRIASLKRDLRRQNIIKRSGWHPNSHSHRFRCSHCIAIGWCPSA